MCWKKTLTDTNTNAGKLSVQNYRLKYFLNAEKSFWSQRIVWEGGVTKNSFEQEGVTMTRGPFLSLSQLDTGSANLSVTLLESSLSAASKGTLKLI